MTKKTGLPGKKSKATPAKAPPAKLPGKNRKRDVSARTVKAKTKPAKLPGKNPQLALPQGKKPKAPKGRRQSTKKARPAGKEIPTAPPVGDHQADPDVDPRIVALRQVADWILRGENEVSIQEAIKAKFPAEDAVELLVGAFEYIGELAGTDPELRRTWHIAARREIYRRVVEIHDFKTARDILRDLAQLEGLYPRMSPTKSKTQADDDQAEPEAEDTMEGYPTIQ